MLFHRFGEHALKGGVIGRLFEESQPRHRAVQHVIDQPTRSNARTPRHDATLTEWPGAVSRKKLRPNTVRLELCCSIDRTASVVIVAVGRRLERYWIGCLTRF